MWPRSPSMAVATAAAAAPAERPPARSAAVAAQRRSARRRLGALDGARRPSVDVDAVVDERHLGTARGSPHEHHIVHVLLLDVAGGRPGTSAGAAGGPLRGPRDEGALGTGGPTSAPFNVQLDGAPAWPSGPRARSTGRCGSGRGARCRPRPDARCTRTSQWPSRPAGGCL